MAATVELVLVADGEHPFETRRVEQVELDFGGIPGDKHFGLTRPAGVREPMHKRGTTIFNRRQLTIVSAEELTVAADRLGVDEILPEWIGRIFSCAAWMTCPNFRSAATFCSPMGPRWYVKERTFPAPLQDPGWRRRFRRAQTWHQGLFRRRWGCAALSRSSKAEGGLAAANRQASCGIRSSRAVRRKSPAPGCRAPLRVRFYGSTFSNRLRRKASGCCRKSRVRRTCSSSS